MPRHASTHAAGIVITDRPVSDYVPLATNDESVVTQFTMTTIEELGLLKMDFLGLRTLTVINDCVKMVQRKNPDFDIFETLKAPDFIGGAQIIYDRNALEEVYKTGRGSLKLRAKYSYDKSNNCIDITEIPATTTCEAIIEKIIEKVKARKAEIAKE